MQDAAFSIEKAALSNPATVDCNLSCFNCNATVERCQAVYMTEEESE